MNILIASSEVVPFAKTGGLADVAGALPKEIKKLKHDVVVVMPCYKTIDKNKFKLELVGNFDVQIAGGIEKADLYKTKLDKTTVPVYFIANPKYFDRDHLYQESGEDYIDNDERFAFFDRAILEMCKYLDYKPELIHCNDWQTALVPVYLKTLYLNDPFYTNTATLFTIHNLAYQGLFEPKKALQVTQLPAEVFSYEKLEFWGKFSFIKGGLIYADLLNTVSDMYSKEIQTEEYGCGLQGLLSTRSADLYGVINGIDYSVWDPKADPNIKENYSLQKLEGKEINKKELLKQYGLKYKENTPVIGVISRLADQKGFDLIAEIIDQLMQKNLQIVILGTGEPKYHQLFASIAEKYPAKAGIALKYDAMLAQLIYAGSDMFLMPSRYEPCGLGQLISLKYGTIPIVRETGGLADTIVDYDLVDVFEADKANGFMFLDYNSEKLLEKIERAVEVYADEKAWKKLMKNAMKYDFSWKASAIKYMELYFCALGKKQG
ncbi:MAG: glycogen synthase GlgA [Candidatus Margulisiibacteriota bacterium]|nr:MAG: starch synthase [Candidatus Margulisbacteria bacterium GWD2_39_127]OGI04561.1 MAG: starch synthase [Candidatus Margulisbacteria bacterium GWF2_38_17]OGI11906.1 MAG: starch synthase [Candidatus Margulisbacteria bacterium GWE2_39_32]PZM83079.1 MAG: glycogen synthase GlgA [Candidatus Margulisiibacteriota bacterium]HAR62254.1 glycogen synthase GlgA [Candidatus Margulisiibacteriota bacterium]